MDTIMQHFEVPTAKYELEGNLTTRYYKKSKAIEQADLDLLNHECFELGRPGEYMEDVETAWLEAINVHQEHWFSSQHAFVERFRMLKGEVEDPCDLRADGTMDYLEGLWYKAKPEAVVANNKLLLEEMAAVDEAHELYLGDQPITPEQAEMLKVDWDEYCEKVEATEDALIQRDDAIQDELMGWKEDTI